MEQDIFRECPFCDKYNSAGLMRVECGDSWITIDVGWNTLRVFSDEYLSDEYPGFIATRAINFCPMCGRNLTDNHHYEPNEALSLDELEQMEGEPVWAFDTAKNKGRWFIYSIHNNLHSGVIWMDALSYIPKCAIGKRWLLYPHKPDTL